MSIMDYKRLRELAERYSYRCGECGPEFRRECPKCSDQAYAIECAMQYAIRCAIASLEAAPAAEQPSIAETIRVSVEYPDGGRVFSADYARSSIVCVDNEQVWPKPSAEQAQQPARQHCTCAFDNVPGEYPCAVHGEQPAPADVPPMPDADDDDWWGTASADDIRAIVFAREAAITAERDAALARADKAEAELAALRGQEPHAREHDGAAWGIQRMPGKNPLPPGTLLYAAPVPAPDSLPREQHEAALAQARRDERERVAAVLNNRGWHDATVVVLALPDAGGEGNGNA